MRILKNLVSTKDKESCVTRWLLKIEFFCDSISFGKMLFLKRRILQRKWLYILHMIFVKIVNLRNTLLIKNGITINKNIHKYCLSSKGFV